MYVRVIRTCHHGCGDCTPVSTCAAAIFAQDFPREVVAAVAPHANRIVVGYHGTLQDGERWCVNGTVTTRKSQSMHVNGRAGCPVQEIAAECIGASASVRRTSPVKSLVVCDSFSWRESFRGAVIVRVATLCIVVSQILCASIIRIIGISSIIFSPHR